MDSTSPNAGNEDTGLTDDVDPFGLLEPAELPDEIGRLDGYRVLEVVGSGGMGVVFRAEDPRLERPVALKVMKPAFSASRSARDRFLREAKATAAIEHDHIVTIYQAGETEAVAYIAMQFLRGESLRARIERQKQLEPPEVIRIGREVARGLEAAHRRGLIHRDIKPDNIWLEEDSGRVKILDFGLVRSVTDDAQLTQSGTVLGTPRYMAPEQARGESVDHRSDLFSLGSVMYQAVSGGPPFVGSGLTATLLAVTQETPPPLTDVCPSIMPELAALIDRLLVKERECRPASAAAVAHELAILEEQGHGDHLAVTGRPAPQDTRRNDPVVTAAVQPAALDAGPIAPRSTDRLPGHSTLARWRQTARRNSATLLVACGGLAAVVLLGGSWLLGLWSSERGDVSQPPPVDKPAAAGTHPAGPPATDAEEEEWIDLLSLVDPSRDVPQGPMPGGTWTWANASLRSPVQEFARIRVPRGAEGAYELHAEFTRREGSDAVNFFLPVATRQVLFVVDGFAGRGISGLQAVQREGTPEPGRTGVEGFRVQNGKRYTIQIEVTIADDDATIRVSIGGTDGFDFAWTGPIADLSLIDNRFTLDGSQFFGVGAWESEVDFHMLKYRPVPPEVTDSGAKRSGIAPSSMNRVSS